MAGKTLAVGDLAPTFALQSTSGEVVKLSDLRGRRVVLYFYPKDDTPGCTKEACSFRDILPQVTKAGAVVLGISGDAVTSHQRFTRKFQLTFPLLSDPGCSVCKAYGVYKQKSMYGRTYWGIERTTFIIDAQGRIAAAFPKVSVDGHAQDVLRTLRAPSGRGSGMAPAASKGRQTTPLSSATR